MSRQPPPPGQPTAPVEPPRKGIEVGLLPFVASIVGALLVAGVVAGTLWYTDDGGGGPVETATAATQPTGALLGAPELELEPDGELFTYTVDHDQYQDGDIFRMKRGPSEDGLEAAQADPLQGGQTEHVSRVGAGNRECATVQLVRGSQRSAWSAVRCDEGAG